VTPEIRARGGGIKLLKKTEAECKKRGIEHMIMANQERFMASNFERLYPKLGYGKIESLWIKEL